jgi:plasmid stabilization system protein ParE
VASNVRNYIIAYAPDEKPIVVLAVLHGRRSPRVGLTQLNATLP